MERTRNLAASLRPAAAIIAAALVAPAEFASHLAAQDNDGVFLAIEPLSAPPSPTAPIAGATATRTIRRRFVRVDADRLAVARDAAAAPIRGPDGEPALTLNLFDDIVVSAVVARTGPTASRTGYVLSGRVAVGFGTMTLLVYEDGVVGIVRTPTATYRIRPLADGVHSISQLDTSTLPPESEPLLPPPPFSGADMSRPTDAPASTDDDGTLIDVAVFYTQAAEAGAARETGGIESLVDLMVQDTNVSYSESGVFHRIRRVLQQPVDDYNRFGSVEGREALEALRDTSDNVMDEVHQLRDEYGADLVRLIADLDGTCGRAYIMKTVGSDFSRSAFSVTDYSCYDRFSFAHELGHNMGLSHDRYRVKHDYQLIDNRPHAYSYGFVNQRAFDVDASSRRWRTIMAQESQCKDQNIRCRRIRHFSNPDQFQGIDPRGIAGESPSQSVTGPSNAAKTLNWTRMTVANFRPSRSAATYDLVVESPILSDTTLSAGQSFTFSVTVRNLGGSTSPATTVHYFVAPAGGDWSEVGTDSVDSLSPLGASAKSIGLIAPDTDGIYYYVACLPRFGRESDMENNCSSVLRVRVTVAGAARFTDDPIVPGVTPVKAIHFRELRARIDVVRVAAGLEAYGWTDQVLTSGVTPVRLAHLLELRSALGEAYAVEGQGGPSYSDAALVAGRTAIRAAHVMEVRAAVVAAESWRLQANQWKPCEIEHIKTQTYGGAGEGGDEFGHPPYFDVKLQCNPSAVDPWVRSRGTLLVSAAVYSRDEGAGYSRFVVHFIDATPSLHYSRRSRISYRRGLLDRERSLSDMAAGAAGGVAWPSRHRAVAEAKLGEGSAGTGGGARDRDVRRASRGL